MNMLVYNSIIFFSSKSLLVKSLMMKMYIHVYKHYCLYPLPWDSLATWLIAAVLYDCAYYWMHRACHGE